MNPPDHVRQLLCARITSAAEWLVAKLNHHEPFSGIMLQWNAAGDVGGTIIQGEDVAALPDRAQRLLQTWPGLAGYVQRPSDKVRSRAPSCTWHGKSSPPQRASPVFRSLTESHCGYVLATDVTLPAVDRAPIRGILARAEALGQPSRLFFGATGYGPRRPATVPDAWHDRGEDVPWLVGGPQA